MTGRFKEPARRGSVLAALALLLVMTGAGVAGTDRERALALNERAVEAIEKKEYGKAVALLRQGVALLPENDVIRKNLAESLFRIGAEAIDAKEYEEARSNLEQATAYCEDRPQYYVFLGVAEYHLNHLDAAEKRLLRAISLDPDNDAAYANLGHVFYKQNRAPEAIAAWDRALELDPEDESLAGLRDRVERETKVEDRFHVTRSAHFDIRYDASLERDVLERAQRSLESAYSKVGRILAHYPAGRVPVVLYTRAGFSEVTKGHRWVAGLFDGRIRIPVDRGRRSLDQFADTLLHEYTHYVIHALAPNCPTWLHEGIAQWVEGRSARDAGRTVARSRSRLRPIYELTESFAKTEDPAEARLQYDQALSFVDYLADRFGEAILSAILREVNRKGTVEEGVAAATGEDPEGLDGGWKESLPRR